MHDLRFMYLRLLPMRRQLFFGLLIVMLSPLLGGAQQWVQTNGPFFGGNVLSLLVDKASVISGCAHGIWQSSDDGTSWAPLNSGLPQLGQLSANRLTRISSRLYAATRFGVCLSTDNGLTWRTSNSGIPNVDPNSNPYYGGAQCFSSIGSTLFVGINSDTNDVYRSTDFGATWIPCGMPGGAYALTVSGPNLVLGNANGNGRNGIYYSSDKGLTWTEATGITPRLTITLALLSVNSNVYAGTLHGLYRSTDNGITWSSANNGLADTVVSAFVKSGIDIFAATGTGVFHTSDDGVTWHRYGVGLPSYPFGWCSLAIRDSILFAGIGLDTVWRTTVPPAPTPTPAYITPDAAAPGMCVAVEMIAPTTASSGYFGTDGRLFGPDTLVQLLNASDRQYLRLGPATISSDGKVIQVMLMIEPTATARTIPLKILQNGDPSNPAGSANFQIQVPTVVGNWTSPTITIPRTGHNTIIVDSLILKNGTYKFDFSDPDGLDAGNQAYLPIRVLSLGPIRLENATLDLSGSAGVSGSQGGNGGPGGGGGGGGTLARGGDGFTGGGGDNGSANCGGMGSGGSTNSPVGGPSLAITTGGAGMQHGFISNDDGGGGGTGHPFGTSGATGVKGDSPFGGFGAGSGGGSSTDYSVNYGGGGGGNKTNGSNGGGGNGANGGFSTGNFSVMPLAGGSGGGSGNITYVSSGSAGCGGGGGGAIDLTSFNSVELNNGSVIANGGNGSKGTAGTGFGDGSAAGGGGGSGGAVTISTRDSFFATSTANISLAGGAAGKGSGTSGGKTGFDGGAGSVGRLRLDGYASKSSSMTFLDPSSTYVGSGIQRVMFGRDTVPVNVYLGNDTSFMVNGFGLFWNGPLPRLEARNLVVMYAWSSSTKWDTLPTEKVPVTGSQTCMWVAGPAPISKNPADTELYVVAVQQNDFVASTLPNTTPLWVMSHTSGIIAKTPPRVGKLSIAPALDFGKVRKGTCKDSSFKVSNSGNADLTITSQTFGDPQFKLISPAPGTVLQPGDTITVVLEFCPTGYGAVQSADTVHTTVGDSTVLLRGFTGKGQLAAIPDIDFGNVVVGACKKDTITVTNIGTDSLVLTPKSFAPPFYYRGTLSGAMVLALAPNESTQVVLEFCPTVEGIATETALLDTVGPGEPSSFKMTGNGIQSHVALDVAALDFNCRSYGSFTADYISIFNKGTLDDKIKSITISPANLPITIQVRDSLIRAQEHDTVKLLLNPQPGTPSSGTITIVTESGTVLTLTINARYSPPPAITALDPILNFDSVDVGDSATMCLRITNYSCFSKDSIFGTIGALGLGPDSAFHLTPSSLAQSFRYTSLADSAIDTFCVQFKPVRGGVDSTQFGVVFGKSGQPTGYVKLIGIGRAISVPVELAIDSVVGRPGQTVNAYVRTLNDVTKAAITSVTFRVMFDPMQLDLKGATSPMLQVSGSSVPNSIEQENGSPTAVAISEHKYSLGDREYTVTFPTPLTGKALVAALPFEILMPSASVAPVRLADANFGASTAKLASKTDGAITIEQCDTSDHMFFSGAPLTVIQNTPNPFNPRTTINLDVRVPGHVVLEVYNSIGAKVMIPFDADVQTGPQHIEIDAGGLVSGAYRYITTWSNGLQTVRDEKTMIVQK